MKEPKPTDILDELRRLRREVKASLKGLLTVPRATEYFGLSERTIRNRVGPRAKEPFPIKPCRVGKRVLFRRSDLDNFVAGIGGE
jgi:predicted DNA-binding transcriptional regulator AlpA